MAIADNKLLATVLRSLQLIFAIIILGLTAYVCNWWSGYYHASAPSQMAFLLFCSIWALLNLLYTTLVTWKFADTVIGHPYIVAGVELLAVLFWFAGFIAAAVFLADRVCYGNVCSAAKAATVFAAFEWVLFTVAFAFTGLRVLRGRGASVPKYG